MLSWLEEWAAVARVSAPFPQLQQCIIHTGRGAADAFEANILPLQQSVAVSPLQRLCIDAVHDIASMQQPWFSSPAAVSCALYISVAVAVWASSWTGGMKRCLPSCQAEPRETELSRVDRHCFGCTSAEHAHSQLC